MGTSTTPLWGRSYKLTVEYASGPGTESIAPQNEFESAATNAANTSITEIVSQDSWEPEALRITFDVLKCTIPSPYWYADISIYNLNNTEIQNLLLNAVRCTLSAGYQAGPNKAAVIWDGPVLQVLFDRENVVDYKITLHCIMSIPLINQSIVNFAFGNFSSQLQVVQKMFSQIGVPLNASAMAQSRLAAISYPRGKSCFGTASDYLFQAAGAQNLGAWLDGIGANLSEFDDGSDRKPDVIYSPPIPPDFNPGPPTQSVTQSIIGVPKQTQFGVIFRALLDPRLQVKVPPMLAQLNNAVITQAAIQIGAVQTPLDSGLTFVVAQVRHVGDSRGNEWWSEVTGYTRGYAIGLIKGVYSSTSGPVPLPGIPS